MIGVIILDIRECPGSGTSIILYANPQRDVGWFLATWCSQCSLPRGQVYGSLANIASGGLAARAKGSAPGGDERCKKSEDGESRLGKGNHGARSIRREKGE